MGVWEWVIPPLSLPLSLPWQLSWGVWGPTVDRHTRPSMYIPPMRRVSIIALAGLVCASASRLRAQDPELGACAKPDSIAFSGNTRQTAEFLTQEVAFARGQLLSAHALKLMETTLFATGQYDDFRIECQPATTPTGKTVILFALKERVPLHSVDVTGVQHVSSSSVRDRITHAVGRPADPGQIAYAVSKIDSVYMGAGYYLAKVHVDSATTMGSCPHVPGGRGTSAGHLRHPGRRKPRVEHRDYRRRHVHQA